MGVFLKDSLNDVRGLDSGLGRNKNTEYYWMLKYSALFNLDIEIAQCNEGCMALCSDEHTVAVPFKGIQTPETSSHFVILQPPNFRVFYFLDFMRSIFIG